MRVTDAVSFMQRGFHPLCSAAYAAPLIAGRLLGVVGSRQRSRAVRSARLHLLRHQQRGDQHDEGDGL